MNEQKNADPGVLVRETGKGRFIQEIVTGRHVLAADEPAAAGGDDAGPGPYEYLLAALGVCTSMTLRMYAQRKGFKLAKVSVRLSHAKIYAQDCADCETKAGLVDRIERDIALEGELSADQIAALMAIADKCPVHRTLTSEISIVTRRVTAEA